MTRFFTLALLAASVALVGLAPSRAAAAGNELPAALEKGPGVPHDQVPSLGRVAQVPRSLLEEAARFAVDNPGPARSWVLGQSNAVAAKCNQSWRPRPTGALMTDVLRAVKLGWREVVTLRLRAVVDASGDAAEAHSLNRAARALCSELDQVTYGRASRALLALAPGAVRTAAR
jgi:hypothetical protein